MHVAPLRTIALLIAFLTLLPLPLLAQTSYVFEVDTTASSILLFVEVSPAGLTESDEATSRLAGTVTTSLTPPTSPFSEIQITGMDLTLHDELDLRMDFGTFAGRLDIEAPADEISLTLSDAGEPAAVTDTAFVQSDNTFHISGTLDLSATGLIGLGVGDTAELNSDLAFDIEGSITQTDDLLRLRLPLAIDDTSEISGVPLVLHLEGVILATSSAVATASEDEEVPTGITLAQNYPNPFNPRTTIAFTMDRAGEVTLRVYDALGRNVETLIDGSLPAGQHEASFDATQLPSGIYVYRLTANGQERHRTMVVLR